MFMYKQTQNTHTTELLTDYHHTSIIKLSVRWCVCGMSGKDIPIGSDTRH